MKKQLSCTLIVTSIFTLNALPVQASNKRINFSGIKNQLALTSGQWCFKLDLIGLFCYEL